MPISVTGFVLGMNRDQVLTIAAKHRLRLVTRTPRTAGNAQGTCREDESSCSVYRANDGWIGVDTFFAADKRLDKIRVSVPDDADPEVKELNIARRFKGLTYKFFNHYADDLRKQILGPADEDERPERPGSAFVHTKYDYPRSSVVVEVIVDKRDHPPKPFDLQVDFVAPK